MSDEGLVNLEDDGPATYPEQPQAAEAPQIAAEPPHEAAEEEKATVDAVEVGGKKYAPISALVQERKERQTLENRVRELAPLEQWARENRPYVDFIRANPQLLQQRQPEPVPQRQEPTEDPEAQEAARLMDFYKADGSLDLARGAKHIELVRRQAEQIANQRMAPLEKTTLQEKATQNYQNALNVKGPNGETVNKAVFDELVGRALAEQNGLETLADPRSVGVLVLASMGAQMLQAPRRVAPPANAPLHSEPSGGTPRTRAVMSGIEEAIAKDKGISAAKWQENTQGFRQGRPSTLED